MDQRRSWRDSRHGCGGGFMEESAQGTGREVFSEAYSCWDDFEYIDTFLPRNFEF